MDKLKAGIYCRVSTTKDAQEESIEQQEKNGIRACQSEGFIMVDIYKEKKTATVAECRQEYQRMLGDLTAGRIEVIVVKDVTRLNRDNLGWYLLIQTIRTSNGRIYFYLERQFYSESRSLEYSVKQLIGAEYSIDLSKKVQKAHRERQEAGKKVIFTNKVWGYKTIVKPDGKKELQVDEEEAAMIRMIFQYYLQGYGCHRISKLLYEKGYKNHNGNKLGDSVIASIIRNPKVTGTVVMNKRHRDFYNKKYLPMDSSEWITQEGVVPVIIDRETWENANNMMDSRKLPVHESKRDEKVGRYEGKNILSKKMYCGLCGSKFYVNSRKTTTEKIYDWMCSASRKHNRRTVNQFKAGNCIQDSYTGQGCDNIRLKESDIVEILDNVAQTYFDFEDKDNILNKALRILREIFIEGDGPRKMLEEKAVWEKRLANVENREKQATYKLLDGVINDELYGKITLEIAKEKKDVLESLEGISSKVEEASNIEERLSEIEKALKKGLIAQATSYSVLEWSEKLLVYPERLDIHLDMEKLLGSSLYNSIEGQAKIISVSLDPYKKRYSEIGMKKTNEAILATLKENPKITQKKLAETVGLSEVTICSRLKTMKEKGILYCYGKGRGKEWEVVNLEAE